MPVYEYRHQKPQARPNAADAAELTADAAECPLGTEFEWTQSIREDALTHCPRCGAPVVRLISRTFISSPKSDSDLRNMGFTKLVKRETGVYENVTRRGNESRYMESGKSDSLPDLSKTITD